MTYQAELLKSISFPAEDGERVSFKQGAIVTVDPETETAYYKGYHFFVMQGEYKLLNLH